MKIFILLVVLSTLLMNCGQQKKAQTASPQQQEKIIEDDFDLTWFSATMPVDYDHANSLFDNYRNKVKHKVERGRFGLSGNLPKRKKQSKAVWMNYDDFKAFTDGLVTMQQFFIAKAAKSADSTNSTKRDSSGVSGVRIYFGVYPKKYIDPTDSSQANTAQAPGKTENKFKNKLTIILCGTYYKDGKHIDIVDNKTRKMLATYENHGHLCPPEKCGGATLDETVPGNIITSKAKSKNQR